MLKNVHYQQQQSLNVAHFYKACIVCYVRVTVIRLLGMDLLFVKMCWAKSLLQYLPKIP